VRRDAQTAAAFKQGAKQRLVIQDQIARFFIRQQLDQTFRVAQLAAQHRQDEVDVLGGELHAAVGLNHLQHNQIGLPSLKVSARGTRTPCPRHDKEQ